MQSEYSWVNSLYCQGIRPTAAILLKAKCLLILSEEEEFAPQNVDVPAGGNSQKK